MLTPEAVGERGCPSLTDDSSDSPLWHFGGIPTCGKTDSCGKPPSKRPLWDKNMQQFKTYKQADQGAGDQSQNLIQLNYITQEKVTLTVVISQVQVPPFC